MIFGLEHSGFHHWKKKYRKYFEYEFHLSSHPSQETAQLPNLSPNETWKTSLLPNVAKVELRNSIFFNKGKRD